MDKQLKRQNLHYKNDIIKNFRLALTAIRKLYKIEWNFL